MPKMQDYESVLTEVQKQHSPEDYEGRVWEELSQTEQEAAITKQLFSCP